MALLTAQISPYYFLLSIIEHIINESVTSPKPATPKEYLAALPEDRRAIMLKIRAAIADNLPSGFEECISYGMIGWVVPQSLYPAGYHCNPKLPLPFINLASQKSHIGIYHMGLYADPKLYEWFKNAWPKHSAKKLDMGKSCLRFKNPEDVPLKLIAQLAKRMTTKQWIELYREKFVR